MTRGNSKVVHSGQTGVHRRLTELVKRYRDSKYHRPIAEHTQHAFDIATNWLTERHGPLILDSCCGTGMSTALLAQRHPHATVIGIDKSTARLDKHATPRLDNYLLLQADVQDFWRLAREAKWRVRQHYLLYPNPYPKPTQVQRRWHAHPAMPELIAISEQLEVRSNWRIYCEEFALACEAYGWHSTLQPIHDEPAITRFEQKYQASGQTCWRLCCQPAI